MIRLLAGLEMLFRGWTWIMLGLEICNVPKHDWPLGLLVSLRLWYIGKKSGRRIVGPNSI